MTVWDCFTSSGVGPIVRLTGTLTAEKYIQLLKDHLLPWAHQNPSNDWTYIPDNAPCHKTRRVMTFFEDENVKVMPWSSQSPDLKSLENLWAIIKSRLKGKNPRALDELWEIIRSEWLKVSPTLCQRLVSSMSKRLRAVKSQSGYPTKFWLCIAA